MTRHERSVGQYFASSYSEGRGKFLEACEQAGLAVRTYVHPDLKGPQGEDLAMDCAWIGPVDAGKVLLVSCGTHGLEAAAGAATILRWLDTGAAAAIPDGIAILIVHAINPYGWAHTRRGNEDDIDLNRNFLDHDEAYPENAAYAALHPLVENASADAEGLREFLQAFQAFCAEHTLAEAIGGITSGQYDYPGGLSFGGHAPSWSRQTLYEIAQTYLRDARKILHVDWHTGIGEYAQPFFILDEARDTPTYELLASWWPSHVIHCDDVLDGISIEYSGLLMDGLRREFSTFNKAQMVSVTIEWGTYEVDSMLEALVMDNWLIHGRQAASQDMIEDVRARLIERFYPSDTKWRRSVIEKSEAIYVKALAGLKDW